MALEAGVLSLIIALARGGRISRLAELLDRAERLWLIFLPAGLIAASVLLRQYASPAVWMPVTGWLHLAASAALLAFAWFNRKLPGIKWFFAGGVLNLLPIAANGGRMPVSSWAAAAAGAPAVEAAMRHVKMSSHTHLNFLADIIPVPRPPSITPEVVSSGDVLMAVGIFLLIQLTMSPSPARIRLSRRFWMIAGIVAVTAGAAAFRLCALRWGLPDALHKFTYHPDEIFQIGAMLRVNPFTLELDPGFYSYPSGYINLGAAALRIATAYGLRADETLTGAYLAGRVLTAALGVLTIPLVCAAGARLYGRAAGLLAALLVAIMPLHIVHSHFATVDVPATLWVTAALLGAAVILSRPTLAVYLLAGAAAGFAAGTKYNAALVLLPVLAAHCLRQDGGGWRGRLRDGRMWAMLGVFLVGFFISTPGAILWPDKFVGGFLFELRHGATGHGLVFQGRGPGWFDTLVNSLGYGQGVFLLVLSLGSVGFALARRRREDWIVLSFLIPYYLLISFSKVHFARYAIPILPPLAILSGRMIVEVHSTLKEQAAVALRWGWVLVCAGVIAYTAVYAIAFDRLFFPPDPRTEAADWFRANVPPGATVGLPTVPWFYSPPLAPGITGTIGRQKRYELMLESRYRLITDLDLEWDPSILANERPEYVVMSDFEYQDPLRLRVPATVAFFKSLDKDYVQAAVFRKSFSAFGICFGPTERLPHDLKYMAPRVLVFRRK